MRTILAIIYYNSSRFKQSLKGKLGSKGGTSAESTHLVCSFLEDSTQKMAQLALKGVFQQNFQECSDFVTNSCGPWDSSCAKS